MPVYEYVCKSCSRPFEELVFGAEVPVCPTCGAREVEKQLSVFAVGKSSSGASCPPLPEGCGSCGDPRGPGACRFAGGN